jgi:precorrin-6A/cobalt-precorrin-6A reductase
MSRCRVLVLGGTSEARALAAALERDPAVDVISSLAGRVARPALPEGRTRIGGFGGAQGLTRWLQQEGVDRIVDATHPFAARISTSAAAAARSTGVPLLVLRRPEWEPAPGDRWHHVDSLAGAAEALPRLGTRVFLTTGRQGLDAFAGLHDLWFLVRTIDPPAPPVPRAMRLVLDRGPYAEESERVLMRRHRVEVLVTKNSGGTATAPKLGAARSLGLPVVMVRRPPTPEGVPVLDSVEAVLDRVARCTGRQPG